MEVIVPIGISGSGKSRLYKEKYSEYKLISPDNIREQLTGSISDQSKNKEVFEYVDDLIDNCIRNDISFYMDATNLNTKYRKEFTKKLKSHPNVKVIYVLLPADVELSNQRIQNDLSNNVNRSRVPLEVLKRQKQMYDSIFHLNWWYEEGADILKII